MVDKLIGFESGIVNKIATMAVIGLLGWLTFTVQSSTIQLAVLNQKVSEVQIKLESNQQGFVSIDRAFALDSIQNARIQKLEDILERLSKK